MVLEKERPPGMGPSGGHGGVYPPPSPARVMYHLTHHTAGPAGSGRAGSAGGIGWRTGSPTASMVDPRGRSGWRFDPARGRGSILNRRSVSNVEFACVAFECIRSITGRVRHVAAVQAP